VHTRSPSFAQVALCDFFIFVKHMIDSSCVLLAMALLATLAPTPVRQVQVPSDADVNVQLFLRSFYPDLFQRSVTLVSHAEGMQRQVSVMDGSVDPLQTSPVTLLIEAKFEFDSSDDIREFSASGPYLNEEPNRNLALATTAISNVDAALTAVARAPAFDPERLPRLPQQIAAARGNGRQLRPIASARKTHVDGRHGFLWSVIAEIGDTGKTYVLMFEPFDGRLVSMVER
jgi:hypothetical protein